MVPWRDRLNNTYLSFLLWIIAEVESPPWVSDSLTASVPDIMEGSEISFAAGGQGGGFII